MSTENNNNKEKKIGPPSLFLSAQPSRARGNTQAWSACPWLSATAVRCLWPHDTRRFSSESRTVSWSRSTARANAQPSTRQPAAGNHEAMQRGWPCAQVFTAPYLHPTLSVAQATLWQAGLDHFQVRAESVQIRALKLSAAPAVVQSNAVVPVCASGIVGARPEVGNDPYFEPKNVRALEPRDQQTQPSHCPCLCRCAAGSFARMCNVSEGAWLLRRGCAPIVTLFRGGDGATSMAAPEVRGAHRTSNTGPFRLVPCAADCSWPLAPRLQTPIRALWRPPRPPACAPACVASVPPPPLPLPLVCARVRVAEGAGGSARGPEGFWIWAQGC